MQHRLSDRINAVPPSGIRRFFDIAATMTDVISLSIGEPDFVTPAPMCQAAIRSIEAGDTKYTSNAGTDQLRQALSGHLERLYGVKYDPANELNITVGVSEALHCALLALINPGDEVIVPEPCFVSYKPGVIFAGGVPVVVDTKVEDNFEVDPAKLEAAITPRTKGILLGFPSNPTGAVMRRQPLEEIARIAEKHNLYVFSDEIYDRLVYGIEHTCFASLPGMRERTITLGGFSKSHAMTGWRIGYAAADKEISLAIRKVHQYVIMSAPTAGQAAALEGIKSGEPYVAKMVAEYNERRKFVVKSLNEAGLSTFEPKGAFYAFPNITSTGFNSEEFCDKLLQEERVALVSGSAFGKSGEGHVRLSYAASMASLQEALGRIAQFAQRHRTTAAAR
ncbi:MAG: aminotransferase class I/II-fold pyridoxal phosphate-dependent enzyme [Armatimonadetes bacterium]|nr:aminotransferase class I/II-fold pyridoxal phosphate-dependent enzyme [Armatimonadota bacterium]